MSAAKLASIIITNYNYGHYLKEATDSALSQTYPNTEVIVVDDGSTDNSRQIIASYGNQIIPVLKENGGQASAFNAGFMPSLGEVICFLDSDDVLLPTAIEQAIEFFHDPDVANVHWPLWQIDVQGKKTGRVLPKLKLAEGNLRNAVIRHGPHNHVWVATSGNAWARKFIDRIFPMPEPEYKICADSYLAALAPLFGSLKRVVGPQALHREHPQSNYIKVSLERKLRLVDSDCHALYGHLQRMGINANPELWEVNIWRHRCRLALQEIQALVPPGDAFILVDEDNLAVGGSIAGRRALPFPGRDAYSNGPPRDDETAIRELERLRQFKPSFMVFAWQAFWWLDYYAELHRHLRANFRCVLENECLVVFDLRA